MYICEDVHKYMHEHDPLFRCITHTPIGQRPEYDHSDGSEDTEPPSRRHRQHSSPPREEGEQQSQEASEESGGGGGGSSGADLHFAVGLPWYLMLHGRDHARRSQPPGRGRGGQPRPQNPQVPRFGVPLVIGFK